MKKIMKTFAIAAAAVALLASCSDSDPAGLTRITYYPIFTLDGDVETTVAIGDTYVEPGYSAVENGEDITDKVEVVIKDLSGAVVDDIDTSAPTLYTITYSAKNVDGFAVSVERSVFVYDPAVTVSLAGTYSTDMNASLYGTNSIPFWRYAASYGFITQCTGIEFTELAPGIYSVSDLLGGWYDQLRNIGPEARMTGYVSLDGTGAISLMSSHINYWGDELDYLQNGVFDASTGQISYSISYAQQIFMDIVLNKD